MILRQQFFILEYLVDLDATAAAIRAGYARRSAKRQAARLLRQPAIAGAIHRAMAERAQRVGITCEKVLDEYAKLAFLETRRTDEQSVTVETAETAGEIGVVLELLTDLAERQWPDLPPALLDKRRVLAFLAHLLGLNLVQPGQHALPHA